MLPAANGAMSTACKFQWLFLPGQHRLILPEDKQKLAELARWVWLAGDPTTGLLDGFSSSSDSSSSGAIPRPSPDPLAPDAYPQPASTGDDPAAAR